MGSPSNKFGVRYGRTLKRRYDEIDVKQRASYVCSFCRNKTVRRVAAGIWHCEKCDKKFTGKAYSFE